MVIDLLRALVSIDSVNPGLVPGAAGEGAIVAFLSARLSRAGFSVTTVGSSRPSLLAVAPGSGPCVVLNGHLDTVGVAGMPAPFTPFVDGDRLYGRGAADMKGGVAGLVVAAERLLGSSVRPVLALVADEEDASVGSCLVLEALPVEPEVCLIAEPTDLALCRSLRGFAVVRVSFAGVAAHSSQPSLGVNAVTHLGRFLAAVDSSPFMATVARGGSSPFVIPSEAECVVEARFSSPFDALAAVEALLEPEWQATAVLEASRPPWRLDSAGPAFDLACALGSALGTAADFDAPYWMEAPLWQEVCPTVICGPSGGGLHATDEWVSLTQVRAFPEAVVRALRGGYR